MSSKDFAHTANYASIKTARDDDFNWGSEIDKVLRPFGGLSEVERLQTDAIRRSKAPDLNEKRTQLT